MVYAPNGNFTKYYEPKIISNIEKYKSNTALILIIIFSSIALIGIGYLIFKLIKRRKIIILREGTNIINVANVINIANVNNVIGNEMQIMNNDEFNQNEPLIKNSTINGEDELPTPEEVYGQNESSNL